MLPALICAAIFTGALGATLNLDPYYRWRVIGGRDAKDGEVPYILSLQHQDSHICGAVIIHQFWALTAAHCVTGLEVKSLSVIAGSNTLNPAGDTYGIDLYKVYDDYVPFGLFDDIALLRITSEIKLQLGRVEKISACGQDIGAINCTLSGWGSTVLGGSTPNHLQTIQLKSLTHEDCQSRWNGIPQISNICTLTQAGQGACHGDSGGPLVSDEGPKCVMGIVNWGNPCANGMPDVFARVSSFVGWISNNTNGAVDVVF